ncbi:hypothetical protein DFR86_01460 [Acidianus sulfidivorans JP7]|uniref:Uncharacterized protein n=1 Tax=Acidianus sulfidivorans JP7 TaxID=619593 RepID=A0A2U9IJZ2_9CREN|nr:hypothetical protein [Acidianus sulfidivorans]AWR96343.1 hypothetical protein DFR86_01460 [Acidianus sulfidivorans JP7]
MRSRLYSIYNEKSDNTILISWDIMNECSIYSGFLIDGHLNNIAIRNDFYDLPAFRNAIYIASNSARVYTLSLKHYFEGAVPLYEIIRITNEKEIYDYVSTVFNEDLKLMGLGLIFSLPGYFELLSANYVKLLGRWE